MDIIKDIEYIQQCSNCKMYEIIRHSIFAGVMICKHTSDVMEKCESDNKDDKEEYENFIKLLTRDILLNVCNGSLFKKKEGDN